MNSKDEAKIQELQAQINKIQSESARNDVIQVVEKKGSNDTLYQACKTFTNWMERQRRVENLEKARDAKGTKEETPKAAV